MTPFYFGPSKRQLFGVYHPPLGGGQRGVVLCYPWGQEYLCAHQSFGFLARQLARAGNHVLRFDYYGTGDSAGKDTEGSITSWLEDVEWALNEIRDMAMLTSFALVGLRLGATIAAKAAMKHADVEKLVLWDPVFDGDMYLREMFENPKRVTRSASYGRFGTHGEGEIQDVSGFPLNPTMRKELDGLTAELYSHTLPPTFLISILERPEVYAPLRASLDGAGVTYTDERTQDPTVWIEEKEFGTSGMPVNALKRITQWLT